MTDWLPLAAALRSQLAGSKTMKLGQPFMLLNARPAVGPLETSSPNLASAVFNDIRPSALPAGATLTQRERATATPLRQPRRPFGVLLPVPFELELTRTMRPHSPPLPGSANRVGGPQSITVMAGQALRPLRRPRLAASSGGASSRLSGVAAAATPLLAAPMPTPLLTLEPIPLAIVIALFWPCKRPTLVPANTRRPSAIFNPNSASAAPFLAPLGPPADTIDDPPLGFCSSLPAPNSSPLWDGIPLLWKGPNWSHSSATASPARLEWAASGRCKVVLVS